MTKTDAAIIALLLILAIIFLEFAMGVSIEDRSEKE